MGGGWWWRGTRSAICCRVPPGPGARGRACASSRPTRRCCRRSSSGWLAGRSSGWRGSGALRRTARGRLRSRSRLPIAMRSRGIGPGTCGSSRCCGTMRCSPLFAGAVEATEEAVLNSLCAGRELLGATGRLLPAFPVEAVAARFRSSLSARSLALPGVGTRGTRPEFQPPLELLVGLLRGRSHESDSADGAGIRLRSGVPGRSSVPRSTANHFGHRLLRPVGSSGRRFVPWYISPAGLAPCSARFFACACGLR